MDNLQPYKISLDFYIRKIITVNAKQLDDKSRIINITCTENGKKFFVDSSTTSAFVRYKKSDGYAVLNQVDILSDGTVNLELSQQMLAVEGRHIVDIMLINGIELTTETVESILNSETMDGISVLSTMSFYINTEGCAIDGVDIESSYEYNALLDGLGKMVAVDNRMSTLEQTINENETQRQANEEVRKTDEINRAQAETKRQNDTQEAIRNCNTATSNANIATTNANEAISNAQTATTNANQATESANTATENANNATTNANNAAQEVRNVLNNSGMVLKTDIVHDLETDDQNKVPDATQVKILKSMIDNLQLRLNSVVNVYFDEEKPTSDIGKDGDIYMRLIEETDAVEAGE